MDKEKFFNILKSLKVSESDSNEYEQLKGSGVKYAFKHLTEEEAKEVSKYLIRYPHIYYNRYIKCMYGVEAFKKTKNYTDEIKETIWANNEVDIFRFAFCVLDTIVFVSPQDSFLFMPDPLNYSSKISNYYVP